jgi:hypothetical protein
MKFFCSEEDNPELLESLLKICEEVEAKAFFEGLLVNFLTSGG